MFLEGKCEVAVEKKEKVCSWKLLWMEDTFPVRGTHRIIHWKVRCSFVFCCMWRERLVQV